MAYWIFLTAFALLLPAIMFFMGRGFIKTAPGEINYIFGYRTNRSMKSQETWTFAHRFLGRIWAWMGGIMLPVSLIVMLFVIGGSHDTIGNTASVLMVLQLIPLICAIIPTERALKKNFDDEGRPRSEQKR